MQTAELRRNLTQMQEELQEALARRKDAEAKELAARQDSQEQAKVAKEVRDWGFKVDRAGQVLDGRLRYQVCESCEIRARSLIAAKVLYGIITRELAESVRYKMS